jgi:ATP-dependent Lhr-like helicase
MFGMETAGRWSLLQRGTGTSATAAADDVEQVARLLLRRYGVVFRRLLLRESNLPPWRDLIRVFYRLEARGEIRGGRFVAGFQGQQFALAEAVAALRQIRRAPPAGHLISISGVDPLNLAGITSPGEKITATIDNRILYEDGVVVATREAGVVRHLGEADPETRWRRETALVRREVPPKLRAYLGRSA